MELAFQPLIKYGSQPFSKYLVIDIFASAFYTAEVFTCFRRLNRNFNAFALREKELIRTLTCENELAKRLKIQVLLNAY